MIFERGKFMGRDCVKLEQSDLNKLMKGEEIINEYGEKERYNPKILYITMSREQYRAEAEMKFGNKPEIEKDYGNNNVASIDQNELIKKLKEIEGIVK